MNEQTALERCRPGNWVIVYSARGTPLRAVPVSKVTTSTIRAGRFVYRRSDGKCAKAGYKARIRPATKEVVQEALEGPSKFGASPIVPFLRTLPADDVAFPVRAGSLEGLVEGDLVRLTTGSGEVRIEPVVSVTAAMLYVSIYVFDRVSGECTNGGARIEVVPNSEAIAELRKA